jgi:hypothetical protein
MNTIIFALEDKSIRSFLTPLVFDQNEGVDQFKDFCQQKNITKKITDFKIFNDCCPENAFLSSLTVEDEKIQINKESFYNLKFLENEAPLVEKLIESNSQNKDIAKQKNDKLAEVLFNKNEQYLKSLKPEDFYTEEGKINRFFNVGALVITKSGSGYSKPIQATISAPPIQKNDKAANYFGKLGKKAKISCTQKDGKLANIFVEDWGCGYFEPPTITFSEPDDPNGEKPEVQVFPLNLIGIK